MNISSYDAISPIDGRYRKACEPLAAYFSEASLMRYRVKVEIAYLVALCRIPLPQLNHISENIIKKLLAFAEDDNKIDVKAIKDIEAVTNHDVKAVEYYIKQIFESDLGHGSELIHFGLTSQDINNTAVPLLLEDALTNVMLPAFMNIKLQLEALAEQWRDVAMLAHTHGQPASPTGLGKEIAVFVDRINGQLHLLKTIPRSAKFGGATGNFNAHYAAYPAIDWEAFGNKFVNDLGLSRSQLTTQIEHYDNLAALFDCFKRLNTILLDLSKDMWSYISMNYFTQQVKKGEVGSSAMPHKVNPIDFENAEGNLGMANAIFEHLSSKLPVSRLQRDLTDSTVLRNIGVPFSHTLIALSSLMRGLSKIKINSAAIESDLNNNWAVVAEAIQTVLRREGYPNPYEALKELTRTGEKINSNIIHNFIEGLNVSNEVKQELVKFTPSNYVGMAMRFKLNSK
jgi:adenylosuccinate lyase